MALARELGQKNNHFLDPEGLSKRITEYFDDISGMDDGEDFLSEFHALVNQNPHANHARQVNAILREASLLEGTQLSSTTTISVPNVMEQLLVRERGLSIYFKTKCAKLSRP